MEAVQAEGSTPAAAAKVVVVLAPHRGDRAAARAAAKVAAARAAARVAAKAAAARAPPPPSFLYFPYFQLQQIHRHRRRQKSSLQVLALCRLMVAQESLRVSPRLDSQASIFHEEL